MSLLHSEYGDGLDLFYMNSIEVDGVLTTRRNVGSTRSMFSLIDDDARTEPWYSNDLVFEEYKGYFPDLEHDPDLYF